MSQPFLEFLYPECPVCHDTVDFSSTEYFECIRCHLAWETNGHPMEDFYDA